MLGLGLGLGFAEVANSFHHKKRKGGFITLLHTSCWLEFSYTCIVARMAEKYSFQLGEHVPNCKNLLLCEKASLDIVKKLINSQSKKEMENFI